MNHDKLRKLLALARGGVGGEKQNAESLLADFMRRNGIRMEELYDEARTLHWFKPKKLAGNLGTRLLVQVTIAVCGKRQFWENKAFKGQLGIEVTAIEKVEIEFRYAIYHAALKEELNRFYTAFVNKHDIFSPDIEPSSQQLSAEEARQLAFAMASMKHVTLRKALPS